LISSSPLFLLFPLSGICLFSILFFSFYFLQKFIFNFHWLLKCFSYISNV
jgi:hypothetical protein